MRLHSAAELIAASAEPEGLHQIAQLLSVQLDLIAMDVGALSERLYDCCMFTDISAAVDRAVTLGFVGGAEIVVGLAAYEKFGALLLDAMVISMRPRVGTWTHSQRRRFGAS
jgi:uncharacterized protein YlaN (UPF0358 family)